MQFNDRKDFLYTAEVFKLSNTKTALKIYAEWVKKHSAIPRPVFFEVDRQLQKIDPLWHYAVDSRTKYAREISMPAVNMFDQPKWKRSKHGITNVRTDKFLLAHNILEELDYFPMIGDQIAWNGYRYQITEINMDKECYWQQTNVWMGLYVTAIIPPDGDAKPTVNAQQLVPAEKSGTFKSVV